MKLSICVKTKRSMKLTGTGQAVGLPAYGTRPARANSPLLILTIKTQTFLETKSSGTEYTKPNFLYYNYFPLF